LDAAINSGVKNPTPPAPVPIVTPPQPQPIHARAKTNCSAGTLKRHSLPPVPVEIKPHTPKFKSTRM
jgi:hypothetical protein